MRNRKATARIDRKLACAICVNVTDTDPACHSPVLEAHQPAVVLFAVDDSLAVVVAGKSGVFSESA
jgi:hypothetical protein